MLCTTGVEIVSKNEYPTAISARPLEEFQEQRLTMHRVELSNGKFIIEFFRSPGEAIEKVNGNPGWYLILYTKDGLEEPLK